MNTPVDKGAALLAFLKATATIRRKRGSSYGAGEKVLWFADIPRDRGECRSPFLTDKPEELTGLWLEVRKKRMPARPAVPQVVADWVRADELDQPENEPELLPEITMLVERQVPDPDAPHDVQRTLVETAPELRRLADHPEVEDAWLEYLFENWEPWAQEMRRWQEVQTVYESLDFMRRRLEEAEERYELLLAIGLLQWRDPTGTAVARHVMTAPAELTLDAARGLLTVVPAASFDRFRVELDMLDLQHRPSLNEDTIGAQLEALDIQAWDTALAAPLLREIANCLRADAQVEETFQRADRTEERPRVSFAPAIVLRERRPTAYEDLIRKFLEAATGDELEGATQPWLRLLREGEAPSGGTGNPVTAPDDDALGPVEPARFLFPQQKIEKATENLVSLRAWQAFFDRLDEKTVQSLNAWTRAVDRIGKGTGKHAYRHRRTARQYLMDCVPRIPAWVMPLHKLWDSVDALPGLFDTVIVDEASQAGVDALVLLLLAKRIVVVGDEKQNSPEAVGVPEDDIARLAREHLSAFRFRDEFRPDTSLFDHSERTFGSHITLREHFRCVPEIIRFSNDLCYRDAPLIPLRQAPPDRLPPLRSRFVAEGACEGNGQRIQNRAEAEALVETIASLVVDEAFEGKTMGVIALQGHAQAQLIETLVAQRLDPRVIEERRLRCGEPATFQGDQRDIVFLSLVIAPSVQYRALARLPDQRRFNVAMSRARDQVWLFHSVRSHDLGPDDLRRRLVSFFESPQNAALDALFEDLDRLEREARGQWHSLKETVPFV